MHWWTNFLYRQNDRLHIMIHGYTIFSRKQPITILHVTGKINLSLLLKTFMLLSLCLVSSNYYMEFLMLSLIELPVSNFASGVVVLSLFLFDGKTGSLRLVQTGTVLIASFQNW